MISLSLSTQDRKKDRTQIISGDFCTITAITIIAISRGLASCGWYTASDQHRVRAAVTSESAPPSAVRLRSFNTTQPIHLPRDHLDLSLLLGEASPLVPVPAKNETQHGRSTFGLSTFTGRQQESGWPPDGLQTGLCPRRPPDRYPAYLSPPSAWLRGREACGSPAVARGMDASCGTSVCA